MSISRHACTRTIVSQPLSRSAPADRGAVGAPRAWWQAGDGLSGERLLVRDGKDGSEKRGHSSELKARRAFIGAAQRVRAPGAQVLTRALQRPVMPLTREPQLLEKTAPPARPLARLVPPRTSHYLAEELLKCLSDHSAPARDASCRSRTATPPGKPWLPTLLPLPLAPAPPCVSAAPASPARCVDLAYLDLARP